MATQNKRQTKGVLYVRDIDKKVKHRFKVMCAEKDTTMTDEIERLMTESVDQHQAETTPVNGTH